MVAANAELGQMGGEYLALLKQRRHQTISNAPVRGAFADRVDARIGGGLHRIVDDDALVHMQAHAFGQRRVGANAHGHDHQIGQYFAAVFELDGFDATTLAVVLIAHQLLRLRAHEERHAAFFQRFLQQLARYVVELAFHQPRPHVHDAHRHAPFHQAVGRFQAQQTAADHHRVFVGFGRFDHGLRVGDVAVSEHTLQVFAGNGQHEGVGARGHDEAVVGRFHGLAAGFSGVYDALHAVHRGHRPARVQGHAVVGVPAPVVQHDLFQRLLAGEHWRQEDAVVVGVRFGAEYGDVVKLGRDFDQLFQRAHTGHAVADHHEVHLFHGVCPVGEIGRVAEGWWFSAGYRSLRGTRSVLRATRSNGGAATALRGCAGGAGERP